MQYKVNRHVKRNHVAKLKASCAKLDIDIENDIELLAEIKAWANVQTRETAIKCYEEGCSDIEFTFPNLRSYRDHIIKWHNRELKSCQYSFSSSEGMYVYLNLVLWIILYF